MILLSLSSASGAQDTLTLGNDPWPPFVLEGEAEGTAEQLVCEALRRGGQACSVVTGEWQATLDRASAGELDGIAALWKTAERQETILFSGPYMTNRIITVRASGSVMTTTLIL